MSSFWSRKKGSLAVASEAKILGMAVTQFFEMSHSSNGVGFLRNEGSVLPEFVAQWRALMR
jgi:hypothetical protein